MLKIEKRSWIDYGLALLVVIFLVIFKIPHLSLPHFWDEAWSYSPAVQYMYEHGLGITPGALPATLSKGHPLFFYFLSASWMKIFGDSLVAKHAFALVLSLALVITVFVVISRRFSSRAALFTIVLFVFQALFLAQSAMLLPEILITLLTFLTLFAYIDHKKISFIIFGSLLMMTKETGLFLFFFLFIFENIRFLADKNAPKNWVKQFWQNVILAAPVVVFFLYLVIQKMTYGWYLNPEHINLITSFSAALTQLENYANQFFVIHGQIFLLLLLLISLLISVFCNTFEKIDTRPVSVLFFYMAGFLLFSSYMFFSPRYLLNIHLLFAALCGIFLANATKSNVIVSYIIAFAFGMILFYFARHVDNNGDYDLGYVKAVKLQKSAVAYCEDSNLYDKPVYGGFLMREIMTQPCAGFLKDKPFTQLRSSTDNEPAYLIFSNIEWDPAYGQFNAANRYSLIKRFDDGWMWVEIYGLKPPEGQPVQ
jgi:4-amino-4-deoxy-L-arabinose transferase-like glycosyltransferase